MGVAAQLGDGFGLNHLNRLAVEREGVTSEGGALRPLPLVTNEGEFSH